EVTGVGPGGRPPGPGRLPSTGAGRPVAGRIAQRDGRVAVEAVVPLGRLTSAQALALADTGHAVRLTPWRTVVLPDLSPAEADRAEKALDAMGLVTDPASPWAGVTACAGRPGCAKALADVRADARHWVESLDRAPATPVHWAGCERRCGLPRGPVVQLIATTNGYEERHP
ncbi:precorrin-3B synthase, partial [Nonomuraea wenchangensis]